MNAAVRAVVRAAIYRDWNVVGIRRGYAGLLEEDYLPLFRRSVGGIIHRGGTMLRTARCPNLKNRFTNNTRWIFWNAFMSTV